MRSLVHSTNLWIRVIMKKITYIISLIILTGFTLLGAFERNQGHFRPIMMGTENFARQQVFQDLHSIDTNQERAKALENWHIDWYEYDPKVPFTHAVGIRTGYFQESDGVDFRGNILYLQGLGDSMLNHRPFFETLSKAGYRVISFDYMGQGGSTGTMNHTRVYDKHFPSLSIHAIAEYVWQRHKRVDKAGKDHRTGIGWSTGGLAAYEMANRRWAHEVILIAPGLAPKYIIGKKFKITLDTLTSASYPKGKDPHVDPIKPTSPLKVPLFSTNLVTTSVLSQKWDISNEIRGLVFLGGKLDRYVHSDRVKKLIKKRASHFQVVQYKDAYHEIDNEVPGISLDMYARVINFLNKRR